MASALLRLGLAAGVLVAGCTSVEDDQAITLNRAPLVGGQPDATARGVVAVISSRESCSGSLIAPNLVLTARHCLAAFTGGGVTVQCGRTNFAAADAPSTLTVVWADDFRNAIPASTTSPVTAVRTPPAAGVCGNDVALLILAGNIASSAALPIVPRIDQAPRVNEPFDAVGYGVTNPADTVGTTFGLRRRVTGLRVACVGTGCTIQGPTGTEWEATTPVCLGDSGGPALDSSGLIMGVASRGDGNCQAALYSTVSSWRSFIVATAIEAANAGGYASPSWTGVTNGDAGGPESGSPAADGGPANDAGETSAGGREGGSPAPDAETPASDAGSPSPDAGGCGCRMGDLPGGVEAWALVLLALGPSARRSRR